MEDAQRAARLVALALQARVRATQARLADTADADALHDFCVSVRRLRSWLVVGDLLPDDLAPARARRWLRRLAQATNPSRDDEVFAEWLREERPTLATRHRAAADWLLARIARQRRRDVRALTQELERDLDRAMTLLDERLPRYRVPHTVHSGAARESFGLMMAALVRSGTSALERRLAAVQGPESGEAIHRARIAGKRLRYQLEQVASQVAGADVCLIRLEALQDLLGDHHDALVWSGLVREAMPFARRVAVRDGLHAIAMRIEERAADRHATLEADWLQGAPALFGDLRAVADTLAAQGATGVEIERKYLLHRLPAEMPAGTVQRIEQGYLPGKRLIERVRRVRTGRKVQHLRTVKSGSGLARLEVEEACGAALFAALWPLTEGRRVFKRRHLVPDGERIWAIDEFTDRALVLAEVELPTEATEVTLPAWLAPHVVRDVTGEPAFVNAVLAR